VERLSGTVVLLAVFGAASLRAQQDSLAAPAPQPHYHNRLLVLPYVSYSPQTKLQFGIGGGFQFKWPSAAADTGTRASYLAGNGAYTTKGQWVVALGASLYLPQNRWWMAGGGAAGYFPVTYYGIGPHTKVSDGNLLEQHFLAADGRVLRRIRGALSIGPHFRGASFSRIHWEDPSRIPPGLPGGTGGVISGAGLVMQIDSRNSATTPTSGHYLLADGMRYSSMLGSDFSYASLALDARQYVRVRGGRDVIALAMFAQFNGANVPIQAMAMLGGETSQVLMRGVYLGRFRDRHEAVAQADYRGHLWRRFGYVVFGAAGNVFGTAGAALFDDMKFSYGAGLRFNINPADPLNIRVDYTLTSFGERGLSIGAAEAF
jgi:hypothetical protein